MILVQTLTDAGAPDGRPNPSPINDVYAHLVDRLEVGIVLLDEARRVEAASEPARRAFRVLGLPLTVGSPLPLADDFGGRRLGRLLQAAQHERGHAVVGRVVLEGGDGNERVEVAVGVQRAAGRWLPILLVRRHTSTGESEPLADCLRQLYGLTIAESRIAALVGRGVTLDGAASRIGISPNTARTHLRRAFAKTGTRRQIELARVVAGGAALLSRPGPPD
jgi:DNA-binding CsgD family transcriptional regulator